MMVAFSRSGCRKWAPHPVEVEAILQNNTKISHKICFPNETEQVSTYLFSQPWPYFQPWCAHPGACVKTFNILISSSTMCNKSCYLTDIWCGNKHQNPDSVSEHRFQIAAAVLGRFQPLCEDCRQGNSFLIWQGSQTAVLSYLPHLMPHLNNHTKPRWLLLLSYWDNTTSTWTFTTWQLFSVSWRGWMEMQSFCNSVSTQVALKAEKM